MEFNKIRELLGRYWEGASTLEDEEMLRSFFSTDRDDLPADLKEAQPLFGYFASEADIPVPEFPDMRELIAKMQPEAPVKYMVWQHWMKYAAMLLIAVGVGYGAREFKVKYSEGVQVAQAEPDTYDDPEKAYAVTKKALALLSRNLNKGTSQVQKLSYFNEAADKVRAN